MSKKIAYKSVVICSVILGIFISLQQKSINLENNGITTSKKGEQLVLELKGLKKEEDELKLEIEAMKESIEKYKGEPDTLASALQIKYGIVWEIEKYYNYKVDIEKQDITVNENNEKIDIKYSSTNSKR